MLPAALEKMDSGSLFDGQYPSEISSVQLAKELGTSQQSAWFVQHRIKKACAGGCTGMGLLTGQGAQ